MYKHETQQDNFEDIDSHLDHDDLIDPSQNDNSPSADIFKYSNVQSVMLKQTQKLSF